MHTWDDRKKYYNESYLGKQGLDTLERDSHKLVCEELIELFNPKRVLDCGCSFGWLVKEFYRKGIECYGVDVNPWAIEYGKKSYPDIADKLLCFDMATELLPFDDNYFDLIVAREFVEHIDDKYLFTVIGEMRRVTVAHVFLGTPMLTEGTPDAQFLQILLNLTKRNLSFSEGLKIINEHPMIIPAEPTPTNIEHPNTHCREYWITLFELIGFEQIQFDDKYYAPKRFDGLCGFCVLHFSKIKK